MLDHTNLPTTDAKRDFKRGDEENSGGIHLSQAQRLLRWSRLNTNCMDLPVPKHQEQITRTVLKNTITLITGEAGSGKTTYIPIALALTGFKVVTTEPRVLATVGAGHRAALNIGEPVGETVGYRTSRIRSGDGGNALIYCTDGLALVREIMGHTQRDCLIIDEVHEMNENIEMLLAWSRHRLEQGAAFKLVLMSATPDAERLLNFFREFETSTATIHIPGRVYPVTEEPAGHSMAYDVRRLVERGLNVLVAQTGKREIAKFIAELQRSRLNAEILSLHADLTLEDQIACYRQYDRPKVIVATSIASTSITIADIDAVINCGMVRQLEVRDGIEGLYDRPASKSTTLQWKYRAGRTKPGIYIDHGAIPFEKRDDHPTPEINRVRLDRAVLRFASVGLDMDKLKFVNQPDPEKIHAARQSLQILGCLDRAGLITHKGSQALLLPVGVNIACMIMEANRRGVVGDMLSVAAILEVGGILNRRDQKLGKGVKEPQRNESDLLFELDQLNGILKSQFGFENLRSANINIARLRKALQVRRVLLERLGEFIVRTDSSGNREEILRCICAGMLENVFKYSGKSRDYLDHKGRTRRLASSSVTKQPWVVGEPYDRIYANADGSFRRTCLLRFASRIEPEWLIEAAPHLIRRERDAGASYNPKTDAVERMERTFYGSHLLDSRNVTTIGSKLSSKILAMWLAERIMAGNVKDAAPILSRIISHNHQMLASGKQGNEKAGDAIYKIPNLKEIASFIEERLDGAVSAGEIKDFRSLYLPRPERQLSGLFINGEVWPVQSLSENEALIIVREDDIKSGRWSLLPDEEIRLADGRVCTIRLALRDGSLDFPSGTKFKHRVKAVIENCYPETDKNLWNVRLADFKKKSSAERSEDFDRVDHKNFEMHQLIAWRIGRKEIYDVEGSVQRKTATVRLRGPCTPKIQEKAAALLHEHGYQITFLESDHDLFDEKTFIHDKSRYVTFDEAKAEFDKLKHNKPEELKSKQLYFGDLKVIVVLTDSELATMDLKELAAKWAGDSPLVVSFHRDTNAPEFLTEISKSVSRELQIKGIADFELFIRKGKLIVSVQADLSYKDTIKNIGDEIRGLLDIPIVIQLDRSEFRAQRVALEEFHGLPFDYVESPRGNILKVALKSEASAAHIAAAQRTQSRIGYKVEFTLESRRAFDFKVELGTYTGVVAFRNCSQFVPQIETILKEGGVDRFSVSLGGAGYIIRHVNQKFGEVEFRELLDSLRDKLPLPVFVWGPHI